MSFKSEFHQNIYKPWSSEYVAYTPIYDSLQHLCQSGKWSAGDEKDFESAIRLEATKVNQFMNRKQREIETRINYCQRILSSHTDTTLKQTTDDDLTGILADVNELSRYTRINYKALENLVQEHDRWTGIDRQPLLVEICRYRPLDSQRFDPLLAKVSALIDVCRDREQSSGNSMQERQPLPTYARYWIHPDNITEVKAVLLFNLPMYTDQLTEEGYEQSDRSKTIVFFDNAIFSQYGARLHRDDNTEVINCHWNGDSVNVTFERRIYKKTQAGGQTISESIEMDKMLAQDFISGRYTAETYAEEIKRIGPHQNDISLSYTTARSIQAIILEKQLVPKVRVSFNRLLFKSHRDKHLSISLDNNVLFTKERDALFSQDTKSQLFPYAILEVKVDQGELPRWLSRLLQSRLVFEVPRFSSYLHGVAEFYSPQLALLPWWLSRLDTDIRTAARGSLEYSGLSRSDSFKPLIDGQYRAGYLEAQLDRKEPRKEKTSGDFGKRMTKRSSGYSDSSTIYNSRHAVASETSADAKDTVIQVENAKESSNSTIFHTPFNSLTQLNAQNLQPRQSLTSRHSSRSFLNDFLKNRNKQSEGYILNNVETIIEDDALRQGAVIQMENEVKQKKKSKGKKIKPPTHTMEPKVFFANERTFIHWLQFSALIMTAALTLLNFGDRISTISGATFFGVSMVLALYAFFRYRFRAYQINTRPDIRYDDMYGPVGLTCLLVGAMALNFALRWTHPSSTDTYLGINNQTNQQTNQQSNYSTS